ncbi:MAG: lysophospholipid acyltransferase family protein [Candidatus Brocadiia bacterium]
MPTLRQAARYRLAGCLGDVAVRALHATWQVQLLDPHGLAEGARTGARPILAVFWHRHLLTMMTHFRSYRTCVPVSRSRDGEYAAHVLERFGMESVRGSTSRGSLGILTGLLRKARDGCNLAITPDGPRGPCFSVQPGVALIARRSGLPVCPVGVAPARAWEFASWDRFAVPKPFSRVAIAFGPSLDPAAYADDDALCGGIADALADATAQAKASLDAGGQS